MPAALRLLSQWQTLMPLIEAALRILRASPFYVPSNSLAQRCTKARLAHMGRFIPHLLVIGAEAAIFTPQLLWATVFGVSDLYVSMDTKAPSLHTSRRVPHLIELLTISPLPWNFLFKLFELSLFDSSNSFLVYRDSSFKKYLHALKKEPLGGEILRFDYIKESRTHASFLV